MNDFGGDSFFSDFFGMGGSRRRGGGRRSEAGNDLQVRVRLGLAEIQRGTSKKIKYRKMEKCQDCGGQGGEGLRACGTCGGSGQVRRVTQSLFGQMVNVTACSACGGAGQTVAKPCLTCHGEGRTRVEKTVSVNIPAGVAEGNYIPLRGQGDVGPRNGPSGALIVLIEEEEHPVFERHGQDLVCGLNVSVPQAVLGDNIVMETLDGKVKLTIAPGTQSESILRLRGKGLPDVNNPRDRGDILVKIHVQTPGRTSSEERGLYERLLALEKRKPRAGEGLFQKARKFFT
jgi:molecular chaperone DnaJ